MNFLKYPIDVQECYLHFHSFGYPLTDLVINLVHVEADPGIQLGNQYLTIKYQQNNVWPRQGRTVKTIPGQRSLGRIEIILNRSLGSVFVGVMIPALLVVIVDLAMFWIKIECLPDRIGTGITCLFTLLTQFNATRSSLAANSYVTLMDWFMIMCIGFVVIQMMETIVVYVVYNHEKRRIAELEARMVVKPIPVKKQGDEGDLEGRVIPKSAKSAPTEVRKNEETAVTRNSSTCSDYTRTYKRNRSANNLSLRRRRRIIYPQGVMSADHRQAKRGRMERSARSSDSQYDIPTMSFEDRLKELREFLLEPTAVRGTAEYLPMKIDSISRIIFPGAFVFTMTAYALLAASIDERK